MIAIQPAVLQINIPDNEPKRLHDDLIRAIAAAIRWNASYREQYKDDDYNLTVLAQLLEQLTLTN